ncbi:response regulator transcription factor [Extibacter muris]|uniref:response regulator transcription factor n=1 Tax=Extibacter muris TaxID=1796622 RepID=UPI001D06C086|nr:response regulator transcription factor [Extibacter muris]MCB6201325.1 response regulator transcription factor [Extibacter muris]MCQ4664584.1 response regulator transcription factor [Extibacter muris]MCQ4693775.1 response regulator transcription factor [Extibacter muris]
MEQYTVLVVDDDKEIVRSLGKLLELEGYNVLRAYNGMEALDLLVTDKVHLIILDVMMPRLNGLSALMKIRERNNIPVIMLSAKTEESDKVIGLSMGADDYVTKPYNTAELMARVKSQLRRYFALGAATQADTGAVLRTGGLVLDKNTKQVTVDGEQTQLTATEYKILELLMEHPGYVFPAEQIYSRVWKEDVYAGEKTVMVHIRRIREKIEITPKNPKYLKVVWGIGYKIEKYD